MATLVCRADSRSQPVSAASFVEVCRIYRVVRVSDLSVIPAGVPREWSNAEESARSVDRSPTGAYMAATAPCGICTDTDQLPGLSISVEFAVIVPEINDCAQPYTIRHVRC